MTHVITLPSGQTLLHPQDSLPVPEMDIDMAQTALYDLEGFPYFVIQAQRELAEKKAEIQILMEDGRLTDKQGVKYLLNALFETENRIREEQATAMLIYGANSPSYSF
jgi:hypothetical protein